MSDTPLIDAAYMCSKDPEIKIGALLGAVEHLERQNKNLRRLLEEVMRPYGIYDTSVSSSKSAKAEIFMETGERIRVAIDSLI